MKTALDFQKLKSQGQRISMITCYDYTSARIVAASQVDCILVGDSAAMTMHGNSSTLPATPELIAAHVEAVRRGAPDKFIVGDLPFLAHRGSLDRTIDAIRLIMKSGAQAIKIEGVEGCEELFKHIVQSGIPLVGHLGLTPQSVHQMGGYKVQATDANTAAHLLDQAKRIEAAGAVAVVLECVPSSVAHDVTRELSIPTIGIGAGPDCSGQVLVMQDMLGMNIDFKPKFVRQYCEGFAMLKEAFDQFASDVKSGEFPSSKESY